MATAAEPALLAAILAAPDDDAPRLVYADWLEACGDPRGEFIEVQCALEGAAALPDDQRRALEARELELLRRHEADWARPLGVAGYRFRRGFVEDITLPCAQLLTDGERLLASAPIRQVRLAGGPLDPTALAAAPVLARIPALDLRGLRLADADVVLLVASPHLGRMLDLRLSMNALHDTAANAIARARQLTALQRLDVSWNQIAGLGAVALANARNLPALRWLHLDGNQIGDAGAQAFAQVRPGRLVELHLRHNDIGERGGQALAAASFPGLALLDLAENHLGDGSRAALRTRLGETVRL